jgi:hypothetical protein
MRFGRRVSGFFPVELISVFMSHVLKRLVFYAKILYSSGNNTAAICDKCFVNNNDFPTHGCQIIN